MLIYENDNICRCKPVALIEIKRIMHTERVRPIFNAFEFIEANYMISITNVFIYMELPPPPPPEVKLS